MDLSESAEDRAFREEVRTWLADHLVGEWRGLKGLGGPGRDHEGFEERLAWNRLLAEHRWTCVGWPEEHGGRGLSLWQQVIFHEEYARSEAPHDVNHLGETLLGPTLIAFGTDAQKQRFLPPIREVTELWAQGYSEPDAGSDLANVQTKAGLDESSGEWVIDGQKVWTSNAHLSDWCFVIARTEAGSRRHHGLSFLLVPLEQDGVEVRPIEQLTSGSEFNEVFFTGARTAADLVVGEPGQGWGVAMGLLGFERGVSTLGQTVGFARELDTVIERAKGNGRIDDPVVRDRLAGLKTELSAIRSFALRALALVEGGQDSAAGGGAGSIFKLAWANWHRRLGEVAMDVAGAEGLLTRGTATPYELDEHQRLFLFSRSDTIYGGSDEVQKNILAERVLGLPREPKGA
ncbi:acyl-CoA dehydrogenase family protein [Nocardioides sp. MH1]|uniref:acyl-CoA dehydrogenase family protein n=1 Tax=Nocardioides sp. MH1 TaxID=3242490 RepID=UPI003520E0A3